MCVADVADDVVRNSAIDSVMVSIGHARSKYLYFAGATAPINSGHEVFGLAAAISLLEYLEGLDAWQFARIP
jgi:hypothetical protein